MAYAFPFIVLAAATLAAPGAGHAQLPAERRGPPPCCASRILTAPVAHGAGVRIMRLAITRPDLHPVQPRSGPYANADFPLASDQPRTNINYRFPPTGLVGSAGYLLSADRRRMVVDEAGLAGSVGFDRPVDLVGAWLHYDFR